MPTVRLVNVYVSDLEYAKKWYCEMLNFEIGQDLPPLAVQLKHDGITLLLHKAEQPSGGLWGICYAYGIIWMVAVQACGGRRISMTVDTTCVFCGKGPRSFEMKGYPLTTFVVNCPTCGTYEIAADYNEIIRTSRQFTGHAKISSYIRECTVRDFPLVVIINQRYEGLFGTQPQVTVEELVGNFPKSVSERLDKSMLNLAKLSGFAGDKVSISKDDYPLFYAESREHSTEGMTFILQQLMDDGYVSTQNGTIGFTKDYSLTAKGWNRVSELERTRPDSQQGFIAMWFDESISGEPFWRAIENSGYIPQRIDKKEHLNQISDEIIAEIRRSKFVVADFTGGRGGVYFEAGFAMGLGLPVIWTCHNDWVDELHFDTRQYNHIVWDTEDELYSKLLNRIRATIV